MIYARSDIASVAVGEGHGGCGQVHEKPPGHDGPWGVDCPACSEYLKGDALWSQTAEEIPETYDEKRSRERFLERGKSDQDAITALAMARMAGLSPAEIPDTIQKMIAGVRARIPGETLCPKGSHPNTPGSRYCRECGTAMQVPAPAAQLPAGQSA